jgi:hypothetical protein
MTLDRSAAPSSVIVALARFLLKRAQRKLREHQEEVATKVV